MQAIAPAHRLPLLAVCLTSSIAWASSTAHTAVNRAGDDPEAGSWSALDAGMDGSVHALTVYKGELIAAGQFLLAGGTPAQRIARWNGTGWAPLGSGLDGTAYTLTVHGEHLYVGGYFSTAGDAIASNIARWDGHEWSALGSGLSDYGPSSLVSYNGSLLAAGSFTSAGGHPVEKIALWNGLDWLPFGNPPGDSGFMQAIVHDGNLIVARLQNIDFVSRGSAALWDDGDWIDLGGLANSIVYTVGEYHGSIIAGGIFDQIGGVPAEKIATWNGTNWSALDTGFFHAVGALQSFAGRLAAARGGVGAWDGPQVGLWNGSTWRYWTTDGTKFARALTVYNGELIVAGDFTSLDGTPANRIAAWRFDELVHANGFD